MEELLSGLPQDSGVLNIIVVLLLLTLIPTLLMVMTSFTRVLIILSFTRSALGTQQTPPNQVLIGIALALTFFIMAPVMSQIKTEAYDPYMKEELSVLEAMERAEGPLREFMFSQAQTEPKSLNLFLGMAGFTKTPSSLEDIPLTVLIPSFVTGELTKAFKIGFMLFLPFIMIDMIVSSILMSMGMMMLPPAMVSLPFKILLFVMVDGWELVMKTIIMSFG
ncbi:MAG: flagellar type III secretion system pore protein FliP [Clostridiales bacterium]|nr:flagellar type III secretion system pore protein FliP [Clostridiales bacterium]